MTQPLFIIGNKRSGTSQLVRLLNLHPHIYVSHESDIAWILYQFHRQQPFTSHRWDSDRGLRMTLDLAGHLLQPDDSPRENFHALLACIMEKGTPWLPPQHKKNLQWLGDKKPLQHTDPDLLPFILQHFPDAHFLHIVRHPFDVVASSNRFNQTADGDFWLDLTPAQKVERWTYHEEQVLKLRRDMPGRVHTLRYEDLCRRTEAELSRVFAFLHVEQHAATLREAALQTLPHARPRSLLPCSEETQRLAADYGYDLSHSPGRIRLWSEALYWRLAKNLKTSKK